MNTVDTKSVAEEENHLVRMDTAEGLSVDKKEEDNFQRSVSTRIECQHTSADNLQFALSILNGNDFARPLRYAYEVKQGQRFLILNAIQRVINGNLGARLTCRGLKTETDTWIRGNEQFGYDSSLKKTFYYDLPSPYGETHIFASMVTFLDLTEPDSLPVFSMSYFKGKEWSPQQNKDNVRYKFEYVDEKLDGEEEENE